MIEGWLNPRSKENLDGETVSGLGAERQILGWTGSWHRMMKGTGVLSCCFSVSLALRPQVSPMTASTVPGLLKLHIVLWPLETAVSLETAMCRAVMLSVWKQRQLRVAMSWLNWVMWGWSLGWLAVLLSWKPQPRRIKDLAHNFYC